MPKDFPTRKWSNGAARMIRTAFVENEDLTVPDLCERFGVGRTTMIQMLTGKTYTKAGGPTPAAGDPRLAPEGRAPDFDEEDAKLILYGHTDVVLDEGDEDDQTD